MNEIERQYNATRKARAVRPRAQQYDPVTDIACQQVKVNYAPVPVAHSRQDAELLNGSGGERSDESAVEYQQRQQHRRRSAQESWEPSQRTERPAIERA